MTGLVRYGNTVLKEVADNEYNVAYMHECGSNKFKQPNQTDSCWYETVICKIKGPIPVHNCGVFLLFDGDFENFIKI